MTRIATVSLFFLCGFMPISDSNIWARQADIDLFAPPSKPRRRGYQRPYQHRPNRPLNRYDRRSTYHYNQRLPNHAKPKRRNLVRPVKRDVRLESGIRAQAFLYSGYGLFPEIPTPLKDASRQLGIDDTTVTKRTVQSQASVPLGADFYLGYALTNIMLGMDFQLLSMGTMFSIGNGQSFLRYQIGPSLDFRLQHRQWILGAGVGTKFRENKYDKGGRGHYITTGVGDIHFHLSFKRTHELEGFYGMGFSSQFGYKTGNDNEGDFQNSQVSLQDFGGQYNYCPNPGSCLVLLGRMEQISVDVANVKEYQLFGVTLDDKEVGPRRYLLDTMTMGVGFKKTF